MDETEQQPRKYSRGCEKPRGFATLTPERRRELASQGGKRGHELGRSHTWTMEEAQEAGKKGGTVSRRGPKKDMTAEVDGRLS